MRQDSGKHLNWREASDMTWTHRDGVRSWPIRWYTFVGMQSYTTAVDVRRSIRARIRQPSQHWTKYMYIMVHSRPFVNNTTCEYVVFAEFSVYRRTQALHPAKACFLRVLNASRKASHLQRSSGLLQLGVFAMSLARVSRLSLLGYILKMYAKHGDRRGR